MAKNTLVLGRSWLFGDDTVREIRHLRQQRRCLQNCPKLTWNSTIAVSFVVDDIIDKALINLSSSTG
ncbi:hypothetical protein O9993_03720 [Vibrio lentus]|nr:hypothetical protein [Vibrio lentus]